MMKPGKKTLKQKQNKNTHALLCFSYLTSAVFALIENGEARNLVIGWTPYHSLVTEPQLNSKVECELTKKENGIIWSLQET